MVTTDGVLFLNSGPCCMSVLKNGAFYDIDQGVDSDHVINNHEHFYDREALTEYNHSLLLKQKRKAASKDCDYTLSEIGRAHV